MNNSLYNNVDSQSGLVVWAVLLEGARQARSRHESMKAIELYGKAIHSASDYYHDDRSATSMNIVLELETYLSQLTICIPDSTSTALASTAALF
ncbi:hypothetical protein KBI23_03930 [bacterium]|nr:hypothetical protein [bacterium]MBP9809980.1 hypothetical protein [bacterium]